MAVYELKPTPDKYSFLFTEMCLRDRYIVPEKDIFWIHNKKDHNGLHFLYILPARLIIK